MNKLSTKKDKLRNYSVLAGTIAAASAANAQIVYTDITPDQVVNAGGSYMLDMNNNASPEFAISCVNINSSFSGFSVVGTGVTVTTIGTAEAMANAGSSLPINYVDALNFGAPINNTQNFMAATGGSSQSFLMMAASGTIGGIIPFTAGPWLGQSDKYMGVRFPILSATHYGWARLSVNAGASQFTIKDYAYNGTASTAIFAGDNASAISENLRDDMNMFISNGQLNINVLKSNLTNGTVKILNINGQEVATFNLNDASGKFDVSTFAAGVYVITVSFDQGMATEKLFIQ